MANHQLFLTTAILVIILLSGCISVPLSPIKDSSNAFPEAAELHCKKLATPTIGSSATYSPPGNRNVDIVSDLSGELAKTDVMGTLSNLAGVVAYEVKERGSPNIIGLASPQTRTAAPEPASKITASQFRDFVRAFGEQALALKTYTTEKKEAEDGSLRWLFKKYFQAYVDGNFVDRNGNKRALPQIKNSISNDVISAPLAIFLEAFFDLKLRMPILVEEDPEKCIKEPKKCTYYPAGNKNAPTAVTIKRKDERPLFPVLKVISADAEKNNSQCGITKREAKAIGFASNLRAAES